MRSRFEIRWEKIMVLTRPKRGPRGGAGRREGPERICTPKKIQPSSAKPRPKRVWNQYAMRLCTTKPPAKESRAKMAAMRRTKGREGVAASAHPLRDDG